MLATMFSKTRTVDDILAGLSIEQFEPCDGDNNRPSESIAQPNQVVSKDNGINLSSIKENELDKIKTKAFTKPTWNKFIIESAKGQRNQKPDNEEDIEKIFKKFDPDYVTSSDEEEGEDSYEYSDDDEEYYQSTGGQGTNKQNGQTCKTKSAQSNTQTKSVDKVTNYQPNEKVLKKFLNKINVEKYEGPSSLPIHAKNALIECNKKADMDRIKTKDKHDRATAEQVMDPRTRMILFKLISRGMVGEVNGCISTGKEANVYHASPGDKYKVENPELEKEFAIKIYKTSILVFKDRDKYVNGEFRFRHGYCKKNPRKMVRTWAEKEMRNLTRMYSEGLNVPKPILLKSHVLLMTFLGQDGWPAAKLKDTPLSESAACKLYRECVVSMWRMYNKCHLVHADLSEYNMLVHNATLYLIDVAQSVEHDHPHALQFLRKDCDNVTDFFRKQGVAVMTVKQLFDFITDKSIEEAMVEDYLDKISAMTSQAEPLTNQEEVEAEVFKQAYIPQTLNEVIDFERDINLIKSGHAPSNTLIYQNIVGLKADLSGPKLMPELLDQPKDKGSEEEEEESSGEESEGSSEEGENGVSKFVNSSRPKGETAEMKKLRKQDVKQEKAEKRKTKIKKHVKKRKEKAKIQKSK
uniref:Serine/threonine-protein kinase RIO1 n=1 Tax=Cacopsylla melanoneura TaxID=428564 RepID=A0A8D8XA43_9HEMI